jgi:hypothetical protein
MSMIGFVAKPITDIPHFKSGFSKRGKKNKFGGLV